MMKKGFLSFVLAAVFLFAIVTAAARFSSVQPDSSYQQYQMLHLQELAIKKAFYDSTAAAAAEAYGDALAADVPPKLYVEGKVAQNTVEFASELESQIASGDYELIFWCRPVGVPSYLDISTRQKASKEMADNGHAVVPDAAAKLPPDAISFFAVCPLSLNANVKLDPKKPGIGHVDVTNLGFSVYSKKTGIGYAAAFPPAKGVDFA